MIKMVIIAEKIHPAAIRLDDYESDEITDQETSSLKEKNPIFFKASDSLTKILHLQWWVYVIFVIGVFSVFLMLNYIVKKVNESRLDARMEERMSRMTNTSLVIPKENTVGYILKPNLTNETDNTQTAISLIFTKEDNQRIAARPFKPKKYIRDQNGFSLNTVSSNWFSKGIKLVSSNSFAIVSKGAQSNDVNIITDSKRPQKRNSTIKLKSISNPVDVIDNGIQNVNDMSESIAIAENKTGSLTNFSINEEYETNNFKNEMLMHTSNDIKTESRNNVKDSGSGNSLKSSRTQSKETDKSSATSENSQNTLLNKFLGNIYKINKWISKSSVNSEHTLDIKSKCNIKSASDIKSRCDINPKSNMKSKSDDNSVFTGSDITMVGTQNSSTIVREKFSNVSEDPIALINDSNYILLESNHANRTTDHQSKEGDDDKNNVNLGKKDKILVEIEYKGESGTNPVEDSNKTESSPTSDASSNEISLLLETFLSEIIIHSSTNVRNEGPKNTEAYKKVDQNHLNKVLSKDDLDNETQVITHDLDKETKSKVSPVTSITKSKSDTLNNPKMGPSSHSHDHLRSNDNILRKPTNLTTVASESNPKQFFNDLAMSPAEYGARITEDISSDKELKSTRSNLT